MKQAVIVVMIIATQTGCLFWRSTALHPKRFAFIPAGTKPGTVAINIDEYGLDELTIGVGVYDDMIYVADNSQRRFQVMKPDGDIKLIIGSAKELAGKNLPVANFNFGTIGAFTAGEDGSIYIQNRFATIRDNQNPDRGSNDSIDYSPSYIVVFDRRGALQYTLGQKGTPETPFYHIERLWVDAKGRLIVSSRSGDSWNLFRFNGKARDIFVNYGTIEFRDRNEDEVYEGRIDNIRPFSDGDKVILSVSYYHGTRLKYIKLIEYPLEGSGTRIVRQIPDPQYVLFDIIDDKYIYLWNVADGNVRFEICSLNGNILNNTHIRFNGKPNYYTKIFRDEEGTLYSFHIVRFGVEIIKWE